MMPVMVKEADLNRMGVPEDYEVLDATALGRRLGFKRDTVLAYLSRRNFRRIPRPNRLLTMRPIWWCFIRCYTSTFRTTKRAELPFRALLTEGNVKVRFYRDAPVWVGEVLA